MAECASEPDRKIGAAAGKIARRNKERLLYVRQAVKDAPFGMEHVVPSAYAPLKPGYWELHGSRRRLRGGNHQTDRQDRQSGGSSVRASPRPENHARVKDGAHAQQRRADL